MYIQVFGKVQALLGKTLPKFCCPSAF